MKTWYKAFLFLMVCALPAQAATLSMTVDPDATLSSNKIALTVTGTYSCDDFVQVSVSVQQAAGREIAFGFGFVEDPICDGEINEFAITVLPDAFGGSPPWHGGQAQAQGTNFANNTGEFVTVNQQLRIRGGKR